MYKNILIGTDGSELANKAFKHGVALAASVGAAVTVVTVSEIWSPVYLDSSGLGYDGGTIATFETIEAFRVMEDERAGEILSLAEDEAKSKGVVCNILHITNQHPAEGVLIAAEKSKSDLIVISSHGRRGIRRVMMGSVAAEVLTLSEIPVLIVK